MGTVADAFNSVAQSLGSQSQSIQTSAQSTVSQINNLTGQIAQYNVQIRGQSDFNPGTDASLRSTLTQLSSLVGVTVTQNADGTDNVLAGAPFPWFLAIRLSLFPPISRRRREVRSSPQAAAVRHLPSQEHSGSG